METNKKINIQKLEMVEQQLSNLTENKHLVKGLKDTLFEVEKWLKDQ